MCGIFGHTRFDPGDAARSRDALQSLSHRGPDQAGEWCEPGGAYLGHRRLSILDLSEAGRQPMCSAGDSIVVTVNGEIYNFQPLREELARSYHFNSASDSEVLVHGYREWGIDGLLARLDGMYAFALLDRAARRLFLVRDRVGIKPLFYSQRGGQVAWASELKALERFHAHDGLRVDGSAIYDYLTYSYVPAPKTLYQDVFKLEPAHVAEVELDRGSVTTRRYWSLESVERPVSVEDAAARVRSLISDAVSAQMMSDVPVGFFLSGGMDSSVVVAEASRLGPKVSTYSIGFDDPGHDETHFAAQVAKAFGTEHVRRILDAGAARALFPRLRDWYDEPFADTSAFPTYLVSKVAREGATVVLTGDGGDEVFGGYRWYTRFMALRRWSVPALRPLRRVSSDLYRRLYPSRVASAVAAAERTFLLNDFELYTRLMGGLLRHEKGELREAWEIPADYDDYWVFRRWWRDDLPPLKRMQYLDFHTYLPDDILTKVDRASMAVALECRVPLLDTSLVEFAFSLPERVLYAGGELKGLLKRAYADVLPPEIIHRPKKGFSIPVRHWRREIMGQARTKQENILQELYPELLTGRGSAPARVTAAA
jgi:asparagine synthase (glutamine-hydrolysing)